ncbi:M1 family peptidase, partial [Myxococcota bacterium]|nr:M1 family peptidase [Myxococcota bacterium]
MTTTTYRLPKSVIPKSYAIDITASPKRKGFEGKVTIDLKITEPTEQIEIHSRGLKISAAKIKIKDKSKKLSVQNNPEDENLYLSSSQPLPKGSATLTLSYEGKLATNLTGLYLAKDGSDKAVVTQCEPSEARAIFPCFDEPEFKASFQWTVRTDAAYQVITNGILEKTRKTKDKAVHTFAPTKVMSSYLVALTIGKFDSGEERRVVRMSSRVWGGRGKAHLTEFSQDVTAAVLPYYEKFFAQRYPYGKLDQVAVPGFDAGAMENVGAIFYRQNLLLMNPEATSWASQKRIAEVVAHELAHQWFGNLVTMKWWDDLWLNEAFATWMAFKAVDIWKPEWR